MFIHKKYAFLYWAICIITSFIVIFYLLMNGIDMSLLYLILATALYCYIVVFVDGTDYRKLFKIFSEDLDINTLEKNFLRVYKKNKLPKKVADGLLNDYASILRMKGDFSGSLAHLKKVDINKVMHKKAKFLSYDQYLHEVALTYICLKEYNKAAKIIGDINYFVDTSKFSIPRKLRIKKMAVDLEYVLRLEKGEFEEPLGYFSYKMKIAKNNFLKLFYGYYYSKALILSNGKEDKETARVLLQEIVENGEGIYLKNLALELL